MKQPMLSVALAEPEATMPPIRSPRPSAAGVALLWLAATACGFPRPADLVGDGPAGSDGSAGSMVAIHVSPSGDDANDGLVLPVKTLKHAIELAAANTMITQIILTTGTYSASSGETFPYIIPSNVTVVGAADRSAILAGDNTAPGVTIDSGGLQDLEIQDFATAITVTGAANLKNVGVLASTVAVEAESTASLTVNNLDITGIAITATGPCTKGIVLNGAAKLVAMTLAARSLGTAVDARDQSVTAITNATISGDSTCASVPLISAMSTASFSLSDSVLDGGGGVGVMAQSTSFHATISNTIIRNMKVNGLGGFPDLKGSFQMTGGELSNNGVAGAQLGQGTWVFNNVSIRQNNTITFYLQDANLVMRNCAVVGNAFGIDVFQGSTADLGTAVSPGGNTFQNNGNASIFAESGLAGPVSAIGNTWNPNVQDADGNGKYSVVTTIQGPVAPVNNGNFEIAAGNSLSR